MRCIDVKECMLTLQSKRCEGYDCIPVCVLADAHDCLLEPMTQHIVGCRGVVQLGGPDLKDFLWVLI